MKVRTARVSVSIAAAGCAGAAAVAPGCFGSSAHVQYDRGAFDATSMDGAYQAPDTGSDAADAAMEAAVEAGNDAAPEAAADAAPEADAGCATSLPNGWQPPAYVAAAPSQGGTCHPSSNVPSYYDPCFGDAALAATCQAATGDGGVCGACLYSDQDASAYAPIVTRVVPTLNVAGCVQSVDTTDAGYACAVAMQAAQACVEAACQPSCPVSDVASRNAFLLCEAAAAAGSCASFVNTAAACIGQESVQADGGSGAAAGCFVGDGSDQQAEFLDIAAYFCHS